MFTLTLFVLYNIRAAENDRINKIAHVIKKLLIFLYYLSGRGYYTKHSIRGRAMKSMYPCLYIKEQQRKKKIVLIFNFIVTDPLYHPPPRPRPYSYTHRRTDTRAYYLTRQTANIIIVSHVGISK